MYPSLPVDTVDFGPDVIFAIPDPSHPAANGSAKHAEAICPLAHTTAPGVKKDKSVVVAGESLVCLTMRVRATIQLYSVCATGLLVGQGSRHSTRDGRRAASRAFRVIDPFEEIPLEPAHQRDDHTVLVSPGRLCVWAERGGLCGVEI